MARKKKINGFTEEEWKQINDEVERRSKEHRIKRAHEMRKQIVPEIMRLVIYKYKFDELDNEFMMNLYKFLINNSGFSEEEKDNVEFEFASDFLFTGSRGVPEGTDIGFLINNIRDTLKVYREPN